MKNLETNKLKRSFMGKIKLAFIFSACLFCITSYAETAELFPGDTVVFRKPSPNIPYYAACTSKKLARKINVYHTKRKYHKYDRFMGRGLCIQARSGVKLHVINSDNEYAEVKFNDPSISKNLWISQAWVKKIN